MASTKPAEFYRSVFSDPGDANTTPEMNGGFRDSVDSHTSNGNGVVSNSGHSHMKPDLHRGISHPPHLHSPPESDDNFFSDRSRFLQRSVSVVYARAGENFAEDDKPFVEKILKGDMNTLPQSNISRILDTGDYCLDLGRKFKLTEMQLESLEDARYGGVNPAKKFIDTLYYHKPNTELTELEDIFNRLGMEKATQALQKIVDNSKDNKKEVINDLSPLDFSRFHGTLKGGSSYETNWKDVAEELDMSSKIPAIEATRRQGYNYSMTSALLSLLNAQARRVGEFVKVMNQVNADKMGSLNSAVQQLDKDLKGMISNKKKAIEREKKRAAEREARRSQRSNSTAS